MSVLLLIHPLKFNKKTKLVGDSKSKGKEKVSEGIFSHDSDFEDEIPLVRGKEKVFEGNFAYDSDFEDEISLAKRLRVNNDVCLKCGGLMGFDHDPNTTSKLFSRYFPTASDKVLKAEFIRVFKEDGLIVEEDFFNMSMIYFISNYVNYDIGVTYDANTKYEALITTISSQLGVDTTIYHLKLKYFSYGIH
ncbi:hypothetical protein KY284_007692 [Solanum tuberosum]|nr:hypothetical protein KY284_007692 [Solanum tuberosum]